MRILVTGGTGLLGGRLIPRLVDDGHQVFALTRSTSSYAATTSTSAIWPVGVSCSGASVCTR